MHADTGAFGQNEHKEDEQGGSNQGQGQSHQLPDHMIADRCQGQQKEVACRSGRAEDKVG